MTYMILLAAGRSERLDIGIKKQYIEYNDKPLFMHSLETIIQVKNIDKIIITIPKEDENSEFIRFLYESNIYKNNKNRIYITFGGKERYDSVRNSFVYIEENLDYNNNDKILIHDSARPFVTKNDIERLIIALDKYNAVSLACKCIDTVKIIKNTSDDIYEVENTLDRDKIYLIYTPQGFRYDTIKKAYDGFYNDTNKISKITDDLQMVEMYTDEKTYLLDGDRNNIKITTKEDLKYIN